MGTNIAALQLCVGLPAMTSVQLPPFQFQDSKVFIEIPAGVNTITLSGSNDGTESFSVDDQLTITDAYDNVLYQHDFRRSTGGIQPLPPTNVTEALKSLVGNKGYVTGSCVDLQGNSMGCSAIWLCFS